MASVAPAESTPPKEPVAEDKLASPDSIPRRTVRASGLAGGTSGGKRRTGVFMAEDLKEKKSLMLLMRYSHLLRPILENQIFKGVLMGCLFFALFGGGFWVIFDIPDEPGVAVLDTMMMIVTLLFIAEMVLNCIVDYTIYPLSFFFWMDALGTVSMVFEISFLLGSSGQILTASSTFDSVMMRIGRVGKVGARVGRLSKLMKCISYYYKDKGVEEDASKPAEAKILSQKLKLALSTKVSLLTILLVLVVPLFMIGQYPEEDLSMRLWAQTLEAQYKKSYEAVLAGGTAGYDFQDSVNSMIAFYEVVNYRAFEIKGFSEEFTTADSVDILIEGEARLDTYQRPVRKSNIYRIEIEACSFSRPGCSGSDVGYLDFDFRGPRQIEAAEDMGMVFFIILVMVLVSVHLSHTLDLMVVQPMERMLGMVKNMAADILTQFGLDDDMEGAAEGEIFEETELIEGIFKKFARLATLAAGRNEATEEELAGMDNEAKGVMMEMMNVQVRRGDEDEHGEEEHPDTSLAVNNADTPAVESLPVPRTIIDSWEFDVLSMDSENQTKVALHMFFDSPLGKMTGRTWIEVDTFRRFHNNIKAAYNELPYHNYAHACDVLHTVYRLLNISHGKSWLSSCDQYALLVAALCHDVGHAGKTNPFLVETGNELALRYNDKSPLENMHCAKLFEVAGSEETDVFKKMDRETKKQARRVCIATILHTDNVNHFEMVREISKIYEMASDLCDGQARVGAELLPQYVEQVLQKNSLLWLELFLHFADVSNPLKPFNICLKWAWRVLDEFFDQGDEEKRLGLPVGMLNDREKINRPGSQHGFINFLVAPLVCTTVKLFPQMWPVYSQMAQNLHQWRNMWVEDAKPSEEDINKKDADVSKIQDMANELQNRCPSSSQ